MKKMWFRRETDGAWCGQRGRSGRFLAPAVVALLMLLLAPQPAQLARQVSCPLTRMMSKGLDVVCERASEKILVNAFKEVREQPFSVYYLKIRNSNLPRIPDYMFTGLEFYNILMKWSHVTFEDIKIIFVVGATLEDQIFHSSNIIQVPTEALRKLDKLTFLNLNFNELSGLEDGVFAGLNNLERLSLYGNRISLISSYSFMGVEGLLRLNLGKNRLKTIPTEAFSNLNKLEVLELHENDITHLESRAFKGIYLNRVSVHTSMFRSGQPVFAELLLLYASNLAAVDRICKHLKLDFQNNLEWLELGNNRLGRIPTHALQSLRNLRQLDLDSNNISSIPEAAFQGYGNTINYIHFENNQISEISPSSFDDLKSLEWLTLAHNHIRRLTEEMISSILPEIRHIDLSYNPLVCNCDILWLWQFLRDPYNRQSVWSTEMHICHTDYGRSQQIDTLLASDLGCPEEEVAKMQGGWGMRDY
ncbi:unnamed protein product, partial [Meganyctiphanes norvegica]